MTLIGLDCPDCGREALDVRLFEHDEVEIGENVPVECMECGYRTKGERRPVLELFDE